MIIQSKISEFSDEQKKLILSCVVKSIDAGIHDFLFALQDYGTKDFREVKIMVDEFDIEQLSDGLQGEIFGENGWRKNTAHTVNQFGKTKYKRADFAKY